MSDNRLDLPSVNAPNFLQRVRETLQVYLGSQGDKLDRGLRLRDLTEAGIVDPNKTYMVGGAAGPGGRPRPPIAPGGVYPDLTPPPTPTGFEAFTSTVNIQVVVGPITYRAGHGHAKTIIYGAVYAGTGPEPTFSDAVVLTEFQGDVFAFPVDPATNYRLWAKWVTKDGVLSASPAGGTHGITAQAGLLDDQHIAFLTASKIRTGVISVGEHISSANYVAGTSGWRINGDGQAEFAGVVVRGEIYATSGEIGGLIIDTHEIRSTNYNAGTGVGFRLADDGTLNIPNGSVTAAKINVTSLSAVSATLGNVSTGSVRNGPFAGYGWPAAGAGPGFYLGPEGFLIGNFNDGKYVQISANGNIFMPGMRVEDGVLYFQQANAIDTNNIIIGAVTIGLSATGTDDASVFLTVPPGETWNILVVASFGQSNNATASVGGTPAEQCVRTSTVAVDGVVVDTLPLQVTTNALSPIFGVYYYFQQASDYKALTLTAGFHAINAHCDYDTYPLYDSPVSIIGFAFKR
ncbi:hypothetical protein D3C86_1126240 [compost metagenome]